MSAYTHAFYQALHDGVRSSAEIVAPIMLDLVNPTNVVDVGCGTGTWLRVFQELGVDEIQGVDGMHVPLNLLEIPTDRYLPFDLRQSLSLDCQFDLVMSLEVAEHLPLECARTFVESLTRLGPVVLFSAAIPYQDGQDHLNEQWPDYWASLFADFHYLAVDCLRERLWMNADVEWWYAQNALVFVSSERLEHYPKLAQYREVVGKPPQPLVHPRKYLGLSEAYRRSMKELWQLKSDLAKRDVDAVVPEGEAVLLIDQGLLHKSLFSGRTVIPFTERNGNYSGPPASDEAAVAELSRHMKDGIRHVVVTWPGFWFLDHYTALADKLRTEYQCPTKNERVAIFTIGVGNG